MYSESEEDCSDINTTPGSPLRCLEEESYDCVISVFLYIDIYINKYTSVQGNAVVVTSA